MHGVPWASDVPVEGESGARIQSALPSTAVPVPRRPEFAAPHRIPFPDCHLRRHFGMGKLYGSNSPRRTSGRRLPRGGKSAPQRGVSSQLGIYCVNDCDRGIRTRGTRNGQHGRVDQTPCGIAQVTFLAQRGPNDTAIKRAIADRGRVIVGSPDTTGAGENATHFANRYDLESHRTNVCGASAMTTGNACQPSGCRTNPAPTDETARDSQIPQIMHGLS